MKEKSEVENNFCCLNILLRRYFFNICSIYNIADIQKEYKWRINKKFGVGTNLLGLRKIIAMFPPIILLPPSPHIKRLPEIILTNSHNTTDVKTEMIPGV